MKNKKQKIKIARGLKLLGYCLLLLITIVSASAYIFNIDNDVLNYKVSREKIFIETVPEYETVVYEYYDCIKKNETVDLITAEINISCKNTHNNTAQRLTGKTINIYEYKDIEYIEYNNIKYYFNDKYCNVCNNRLICLSNIDGGFNYDKRADKFKCIIRDGEEGFIKNLDTGKTDYYEGGSYDI